jgi:type IV pilus modification protein PilV
MLLTDRKKSGFTLIELLVSLFILMIGVLSFLYLQTASIKARAVSREISSAVYLAQYKMEELLASYDKTNLDNGSDNGSNTIVINNVSYTLNWNVNRIDNISRITVAALWNKYNKQHSVELTSGKRK